MKRSNVNELLKFSIEKVLKKYGKWFLKTCGNPDLCHWSYGQMLLPNQQSSYVQAFTQEQ